MAEVSVKQLATDIDTPVDRLLQQFVDAGISKSKADDMVSESEKQALLAHLKKQHGGDEVAAPARMTLQRKTKSTISVQGTGGKNKEVQVEVRKSRTYVRRSALEDE
ncbi:translation initiation factor IF-2, partial [Aeromonas veronii]